MSTHMLIDIETLGMRENLEPGLMPEVVQVGVVVFSPESGEIAEALDLYPEADNGALDYSTVSWWMGIVARGGLPSWIVKRSQGEVMTCGHICSIIARLWRDFRCEAVWGNDPEMDLSPLEVWMRVAQVPRPWNYYQRQDVRTLRNSLGLRSPKHPGQHNALEDAKAEAALVSQMLQKIRKI